jgi:hypothetical protein
MRRTLLFIAMLFLCSVAEAKVTVTVTVILEDKDIQAQIQQGIEARINSTERYVVGNLAANSSVRPLITLDVTCMVVETNGVKHGVVCDSMAAYFPFENSGLYLDVSDAGHKIAA